MTPMTIQVQVFGYLQGALQDISGLFLCVYQTGVHTCSTLIGISMFHEGPLHVATSLCHCAPSKPYSTNMRNLDQLSSFEHDELRLPQFEHC